MRSESIKDLKVTGNLLLVMGCKQSHNLLITWSQTLSMLWHSVSVRNVSEVSPAIPWSHTLAGSGGMGVGGLSENWHQS